MDDALLLKQAHESADRERNSQCAVTLFTYDLAQIQKATDVQEMIALHQEQLTQDNRLADRTIFSSSANCTLFQIQTDHYRTAV